MDERRWKVGELAEATGLTVRALHHFDDIGVLRPTERSTNGHRLYSMDDVRRLYRILALRQLGMPLGEITTSLDGQVDELEVAVREQLAQVEHQIDLQRQLRRRLGALLAAMRVSPEPSWSAPRCGTTSSGRSRSGSGPHGESRAVVGFTVVGFTVVATLRAWPRPPATRRP